MAAVLNSRVGDPGRWRWRATAGPGDSVLRKLVKCEGAGGGRAWVGRLGVFVALSDALELLVPRSEKYKLRTSGFQVVNKSAVKRLELPAARKLRRRERPKAKVFIDKHFTSLEEVVIAGDFPLHKRWIHERAARDLRVIKVHHCQDLERLPTTMRRLEVLDVTECGHLSGDALAAALNPDVRTTLRVLLAKWVWIQKLPPGMERLEVVDVEDCAELGEEEEEPGAALFLPESSGRRVRTLKATESSLARLPENMECLEELSVDLCAELDDDFLPESSGRNIRVLNANSSNLQQLPGNMARLTELNVGHCDLRTSPPWLPHSSAKSITVLKMWHVYIDRVPEGCANLVRLEVTGCDDLDEDDWLPASSSQKLEVIIADESCVASLPRGRLPAIRELQLDNNDLDPDFLPPDAARRVEKLSVRGVEMDDPNEDLLLPHMRALRELNIGATALRSVSLPRGSCAALRVIKADMSNIRYFPEGLCALEEIHVADCTRLSDSWLPASSARKVTYVDATNSNLSRLPDGMSQLDTLDVRQCRNLAADWLPLGSAKSVRVIRADDANITRMPPGLESLEELDLRTVRTLSAACFLPESSRGRLRFLRGYGCSLARLPEGLRSLECCDVRYCRRLAADWLPPDLWERVGRSLSMLANDDCALPAGLRGAVYVDSGRLRRRGESGAV
ncbi:unnamed protein product [Pedinophyceae sp. YPF-701]|nr:unnamed protein product [Pedinophyceae sp. YPF-701]